MMQSKTSILVVDDNESARSAVARTLKSHGYEVREAARGADALRLAADQPDIVILDIQLPDLNGYEVCRRLKADPGTASIPVLHLSASFADSDSRAEGLEGGADGYLPFPVDPRELVATIEALLRVRRAERTAREQSELLRVTLASIGDGVIATDRQYRVTFLNAVAQALTGWGECEAIGRPLDDVFQVVDEQTRQPLAKPPLEALRDPDSDAPANHTLLRARGGEERVIEERATPIRDTQRNIVGVVIVFRDVTEQRRVEQTLREANRHKDEFLAMLAHELRNPLAPVSNALQVLNHVSSDNPAAQEARSVMERQIEHLVRLVDDLLDVSRMTRGLITLRKQRVSLATVVARAVESSRPLIDARRHTLEVNVPDQDLLVEADIVRLAQVLLNLLNNAAKYTPEGGRITLSVESDGEGPCGRAVVRVRDTGMGIPAAMIGKVFDLFTQVERTLTRAEGGLGIGLTLVRRLTEMHGGAVDVSSPGPGQGSEFVVRLPVAGAAADTSETEAPDTRARGALLARRILVVDDNRDSADSLATLLRLFGNDVRTAYDGRQGLAVVGAYRPDVILLDLGMPVLNGYDVAKQIRTMEQLGRPYIVAMTGFGTEEDRRETRAGGFDAHLIKPVDLQALQELLASPEMERATP
jgi:PAS domain S-box-containing protein